MAIKIEKGKIPIWEKYMLTVDEAVQYFGIGEKKIRMLISEHLNSECCFTVQVGCKSLINRKKFEAFLVNFQKKFHLNKIKRIKN